MDVARWIVPIHGLLMIEEIVVLVWGLVGGNGFRGIWAVLDFDGEGGVTVALVGLVM